MTARGQGRDSQVRNVIGRVDHLPIKDPLAQKNPLVPQVLSAKGIGDPFAKEGNGTEG